MAKKYHDNYRLDLAYDYFFKNLECEWMSIHDGLEITSGDGLPKHKMVSGPYPVYGGGGITESKHSEFNIEFGTIGIGRVGARCGCVFTVEPKSWITDNALLVAHYDSRFSLQFLRHYLSYLNLGQHANNAMQPVISKTRISHVQLPLIEIQTQSFIAEALDSIESEKALKVEDVNLISRLKVVDGWEDLSAEIIKQKALVTQLKQSILQEAVEGKLTPDWRKQNPDVEPATELLKRTKAEKAKLIKEKKIKAGKKQKSNDLGDIQFDIPTSWVYADLDDISQFITDGTHQTPTYTKSGKIFLSAQNVKPFRFMPEIHKYVSQEAFDDFTRGKKAEKGDLLVGRVGSKGETAVIDRDLEFAFYVSLGFIKTFKEYTCPEYFAIVMNAPYGNLYATGNMSSIGASAGNYNLGRMRSFPVPFPPLEEQKAIVQKVEALIEKCTLLEEEITKNEQQAKQLMQAILKDAFETKAEPVR